MIKREILTNAGIPQKQISETQILKILNFRFKSPKTNVNPKIEFILLARKRKKEKIKPE